MTHSIVPGMDTPPPFKARFHQQCRRYLGLSGHEVVPFHSRTTPPSALKRALFYSTIIGPVIAGLGSVLLRQKSELKSPSRSFHRTSQDHPSRR